jgi:hypothetical protein
MPASLPDSMQVIRTVTCPACGARFTCRPGGDCWCAAEPFRLPLPAPAENAACLCPACLRAAAATQP